MSDITPTISISFEFLIQVRKSCLKLIYEHQEVGMAAKDAVAEAAILEAYFLRASIGFDPVHGSNYLGDQLQSIQASCARGGAVDPREDRRSFRLTDGFDQVSHQGLSGVGFGVTHNESPAGCVEAPSLSQGGRIGNDSAAHSADAREGV